MLQKARPFLAVLTLLACSPAIDRPTFKPKKTASDDAKPGAAATPGESAANPTTAGSPTISKLDLKAIADEVVAPTSDHCTGDTDRDASSKSGRSTLRLLTREEYKNTIQDVLGLSRNFSENLSPEHKILSFSNNSTVNVVADQQMSTYINTARDIAKAALSETGSTLPCRDGDGCAETLLNSIGPQAWRRPLEADEKQRLLGLYQMAAADGTGIGLEVMLTGLFSSPNFLYRSEIGKDGRLTAYETASALSYFFWSAPPDKDLRKAAEDGSILDPKVLAAQAQRLLGDARAKTGVAAFSEAYLEHSNILGVTKNADKFKDFTPELKKALDAEARETFDYWLRAKSVKFADLFTAQTTVGDEALARFYGAGTMQDNSVKLINFADSKRRGILGLAGVLAQLANADESHPIRRGLYVREQILCETMAPTPAGVSVAVPALKPGMTTRERFAAHSSNPACSSCHKLIDGVGFGMEDYDSVGRYRETDENKAVDASGNFVALDGRDQPFVGIGGMNDLLKASDRARRCFVLQAFRQAAGRFETKADVCGIRSIADDFIKNNKPLGDVFLRLITSPVYLERGP